MSPELTQPDDVDPELWFACVPRQPFGELETPSFTHWRELARRFIAEGHWVSPTDEQRQWADDAHQLAQIGLAIADVTLPTVEVELPPDLARIAVAAWARDDLTGPDYEGPAERQARIRAGYLALIGLSIEHSGRHTDDGVTVQLSADLVVAAHEAAEVYDRYE